ncbi:MAG: HTH domain-containing protein [Steroidobacteraceae bacterium]
MKRVERLFALAEVLRGRRTGITAEALAERFGVAVRTIYRDLDALRAADLPVGAERGRGGGYALDRSYSLPPVNFTAREAALLVALGRHACEMRLLPFTGTLGSALEKIRGALSVSAQRELLSRLEELEFIGVPALLVDPAVRAAVERSWFEGVRLDITYLDRRAVESRRTIKVLRVTMDRHETRLTVLDTGVNEKRTLRLDRIVRAQAASGPPGG